MIDARGQSCPIPVVMVQNAVKKGNYPAELQVKVDAMVCVENIARYAASQGYADAQQVNARCRERRTGWCGVLSLYFF